jgi:Family of unknown function (DUF5522)
MEQPPLVEGEDYYWEGPYMVLTGRFLLRRGYCCQSGCRHCPYQEFAPNETEGERNTDETEGDGAPRV